SPEVIGGFLFVIAMIAAAWWCSKKKELRPVAFGLAWFLIASLPTSLIPLSEVENDHRMFLPFVGLTLALTRGAAALLAMRRVPRLSSRVLAPVCGALIVTCAWGAHQRNKVWAN